MIKYGFFDSKDGDRKYNADDFSNYFEGLIGDGIFFNVKSALEVVIGTGMQVIVKEGRAKIHNRYLKNDSNFLLEVSPSDPQFPRWDLVIIFADLITRSCGIEIKKGVASENPVDPELQQDQFRKEFALARITVDVNSTSIVWYNIHDLRGSDKCPWITNLLGSLDTSSIVAQYQSTIEKAEEKLTLATKEAEKTVNNYIESKRNEIDDWFNQLETDLNTKKYLNKYTLFIRSISKECNEIDINYSFKVGSKDYSITYDTIDSAGETALLHCNGKLLTEGVDWVCNGGILSLTSNTFKSSDYVDFTIVKCENTPFNYTYSKSHE